MCVAKPYREGETGDPILQDIAYARLDAEQMKLQTFRRIGAIYACF